MGNDGGSIPDRRDLVRTKAKAEQADKRNQAIARWFFCALSKALLREPVVSCPLGKLYNKDAVLEYLLDKTAYGDGEEICGHIKSLKDTVTLKLTQNPSPSESSTLEHRPQFVCPLSLKEMNGGQPFVYLYTCGCVFSQAGLCALLTTPDSTPSEKDQQESKDLCPQCSTKFTRTVDIMTINPTQEEELKLRETMEVRRASRAGSKQKKSKKRKADEQVDEPPSKRFATALANKASQPYTNSPVAASRTVAEALVAEEQKRKGIMSDAVKSLYAPKNGDKKVHTFMTRATFTRYA